MQSDFQKGIITMFTLVFGSIFLLVLGGLVGLIILQHRVSVQRVAFQEALNVAEAGIDYYRWRLNHFPDDLEDGTGAPGPYVHSYQDANGKVQGTFSLDIEGTSQCGEVTGVVIISTGWSNNFSDVKRTAQVRYQRPTVADYSLLLNDNVWVGSDHIITGAYHSNGGIRMDGENKSLVTSARATWTCTGSFGCNPTNPNAPGVFTTANGDPALFSFPVPPFDFNGITVDLAAIKDLANAEGLYFDKAPSGLGYHVVLNGATMQVYDVISLDTVQAYDLIQGWHNEDSIILPGGESLVTGSPFTIPTDCSVIFFEDTIWVEGTVQGKVTIAAADLQNPNAQEDVWLPGNIQYAVLDGSDGLLLLAQRNNLISLDSPEDMALQGIFIAQTGRFGRNHYSESRLPAMYDPFAKQNSLQIFGTVVSNGRVGTKWISGGTFSSGYNTRETIFDPEQTSFPPPFLPATSPQFQLSGWEEVE